MTPIEKLGTSDKQFFQELDKHSAKLRNSAEKFSSFLMEFDKSIEINSLIKALDKLVYQPIEQMDEAVIDLKNNLLALTKKLKDKNKGTSLIKQELGSEFLKMNQEIMNNAIELAKKTIQLDQHQ